MSERPSATARNPWFFGPLPDLLLGCGLLYSVFFAAQSLAGPQMRAWLPIELLPLLTLVFGTSHYGATLLRVYEQRESRRRYAFFAVWVTIALALAYGAGLYVPVVGSLIVTLYLTWSPWHYSGQNYGVALIFLRRRGVPIPPAAKRFLYTSFLLSYALVFLAIHSETGSADYAPVTYQGTLFYFLGLGIPRAIHAPLFITVEAAYLLCVAAAGWLLAARASLRDLAPALLVVLTQALWFAVPTIAIQAGVFQRLEPLQFEHRAYAFMWVALGHFLQYLWITSFYAAASQSTAGRLRYLGRALLAGSALWVLPTFLFAPGALGRLPFDMGLALLTASVVNLHHFILDGAIWKLRDGRIARVLLRDAAPESAAPEPPVAGPRRAWRTRLVWIAGGFCLLVSLGLKLDVLLSSRVCSAGALECSRRIQARRGWFGRDSPRVHLLLAQEAARAGHAETASWHLERARSGLEPVRAMAPRDPGVQAVWKRLQAGEAAGPSHP